MPVRASLWASCSPNLAFRRARVPFTSTYTLIGLLSQVRL